jgi:ribosomal-protein-alanine N-acetyltransferase
MLPPPFAATIETERLRFRLPEPHDADAIFEAWCQDAEVCRFMVWLPHGSVDVTRQFIASCLAAIAAGTAVPYVLSLKDTGQIVGMIEARPSECGVNIGYVLARAHWGRGLIPEAIRVLSEVALSGPFFRVEATCDVENRSSVRALEKSGFVREGRLARYMVHPNLSSEPRDSWLYATHR